MVDVGDKAPDFEIRDHEGKLIRLGNFRGKRVLIAFFPFAFSPVCTTEFGCFESDLQQFKNMGVQILGISVDSEWSNNAFAKSLGLDFPLLSDFKKEVSMNYGVLRSDGFANRAYFVIDEAGVVKYKRIMDTPLKKLDNAELLKALE